MTSALFRAGSLWAGAVVAVAVTAGSGGWQGGLGPSTPQVVSARLAADSRVQPSARAGDEFPGSFIGIAAGVPSRLAAYSAADGHRLMFLTAPQPGGGVDSPVLSAGGATVAFDRGLGTCRVSIDTVPAAGGPERVLVPVVGSGSHRRVASGPSVSSDGRYFLYNTVFCTRPFRPRIHLRDLATGKEVTSSRAAVPGRAVFLNRNQQVAYAGSGGTLVVRQVPSFITGTHAPPTGCRYQVVAGTETRLDALLQCGTRHNLRLVAVSTRTFTITRTLVRLGPCRAGTALSVAARDPSAILAETASACTTPRRAQILKIRGPAATLVRSGLAATMPRNVLW